MNLTTIIPRLLTAVAITGVTISVSFLPAKAENEVCPNQESIEIERKQLESIVSTAEEMKAKAPQLSNQANTQKVIATLDEEIINNQSRIDFLNQCESQANFES